MFRRRREASRPPASSAWWSVEPEQRPGAAQPAEQLPPLPGGDPFGGWPAFGPAGSDPRGAVLGQPEPLPPWATPPGANALPPGQHGLAGVNEPPAGLAGPPGNGTSPGMPAQGMPRVPGMGTSPGMPPVPGAAMPPGLPAAPGMGTSPGMPAVPGMGTSPGMPAVPGTGTSPGMPPVPGTGTSPGMPAVPGMATPAGMAAAPADSDGWLPLLTHDQRDQRFQSNGERAFSPPAEDTGRRAPKMGKLLAAARRVTQSAEPAAPEPPAETAADATTWLDALGPINPMEAGALAGAFAADYLSWDEAAPRRRGDVLKQYLPSDVVGSASLLGWSGRGRQRAEFALPGAVHPDGEGRVIVDVRVRVTPYRKVGEPADPAPAGELEVAGVPAVAPAPTARGWKSLDSYWVRLTVPITRDQGRLVVDTWDEQLGDEDREPEEIPAEEEPAPAGGEPARPEAGEADLADPGKAERGKADPGKADLGTEAAAGTTVDPAETTAGEEPAAGVGPPDDGAIRKPARRPTRRSTTRPPAGGRGAR